MSRMSKAFAGLPPQYLYGSWLEHLEETATTHSRSNLSWEVPAISWCCSAGSRALLSCQQLGKDVYDETSPPLCF